MFDSLETSSISIVTVCMNRLKHLQRSAPLVSAWPYHQTHIIVDWSSDIPIKREDLPDDSRIQLVRVDGESLWNPSLAYNFSISLVKTRFVIRMDADCWPCLDLNPYTLLSKNCVWGGSGGEGRYGQFLMPLETFWLVGGFNEYMSGWGFEDKDLRFRLKFQHQIVLDEFKNSLIGVLHHSNAERMGVSGFCTTERALAALRASRLRNRLIAAYCPWGTYTPRSAYMQSNNSWHLVKSSRPEISTELESQLSQICRRCFWGSFLALPEIVVELLPERLLPAINQGRWPVRWWHLFYAMTFRPLLLIPARCLSFLRGIAS